MTTPKSTEQEMYELKRDNKRLHDLVAVLEAMVRRAVREMTSGKKALLADLEETLKDRP